MIEIVVENVKRIARASLSLAHGGRTILIGRNNSGKTTLLDAVSYVLWSLPASGVSESQRVFSTSWYRKQRGSFLLPSASVAIPAWMLGPGVCSEPTARLHFDFRADVHPGPVREDAHTSSRFVTTGITLEENGSRTFVARPLGVLGAPLWPNQGLETITNLYDQGWQPLSRATATGSISPVTVAELYGRSMELTRAAERLIRRVLYLRADRAAAFGADRTYVSLSQDTIPQTTQLLLRLHTIDRAKFEGLSTSVALLFPEVRAVRLVEHRDLLRPEIELVDGRTEHAANMGYGFQNALHILTIMFMMPSDGILIIDEPEKGLNQSCQRDLGALIETTRPDLSVLVATQSEALCRGFSSSTSIVLVEPDGDSSRTTGLDIVGRHEDLRRLAQALGLDPIYLSEGGKIIYVEGVSDQLVIDEWLRLRFAAARGYQVVSLGGSGKISEEFVKPLLVSYRDRVFLLLDSDRPARDVPHSPEIDRLATWLSEHNIEHYVLQRRELENYVGANAIAQAAGLHPSVLAAAPGTEDWHDIKAAFEAHLGFRYDERRLTVSAFASLADRTALFGSETTAIVDKLRRFLGIATT